MSEEEWRETMVVLKWYAVGFITGVMFLSLVIKVFGIPA